MIAFLSLFLGLVSGPQEVVVAVGPQVRMVELWLDGGEVGILRAEPWTLIVDLGPELLPHELIAVARDDENHELGRARQLVNVPRSAAEAEIVLEGSGSGSPGSARLLWRTVRATEPELVVVTLDGRQIEAPDLDHIALPPLTADRLHYLEAEVLFPEELRVRAWVAFGLSDGRVETQLTAVPVRFDEPPGRSVSVHEVEGWLLCDGRPLKVVAAEEGTAEIVAVRDRSTRFELERLSPFARRVYANIPLEVALRPGDELHLQDTVAIRSTPPGQTPYLLFRLSPAFSRKDLDYYRLLAHYELPDVERRPQSLTNAVAAAALHAAASQRRRAVLLVLGPKPESEGDHWSIETVRRYLRSLHVPLVVWFIEREPLRHPAPELREVVTEWGTAENISNPISLYRANQHLQSLLAEQRILWVEGSWLPQRIEVSASAGAQLLD